MFSYFLCPQTDDSKNVVSGQFKQNVAFFSIVEIDSILSHEIIATRFTHKLSEGVSIRADCDGRVALGSGFFHLIDDPFFRISQLWTSIGGKDMDIIFDFIFISTENAVLRSPISLANYTSCSLSKVVCLSSISDLFLTQLQLSSSFLH